MNKAKEISALWSQIKPQIGELVRLCHEVESNAEDTSEAYRCGYETAKHECEDCNTNIVVEAIRKKAYEKAYEQGRKDGKVEGRAEAWEAVKKLARMDTDTSESITGYFGLHNIMHNLTASEVIEEIRAYEQAQKEKEEQIQIGDEVINRNKTAVVTEITDRYVRIMYSDGSGYALFSKGVVKTGRHFPEIAAVLEKMRENNG